MWGFESFLSYASPVEFKIRGTKQTTLKRKQTYGNFKLEANTEEEFLTT
jgi:hypothetical protein